MRSQRTQTRRRRRSPLRRSRHATRAARQRRRRPPARSRAEQRADAVQVERQLADVFSPKVVDRLRAETGYNPRQRKATALCVLVIVVQAYLLGQALSFARLRALFIARFEAKVSQHPLLPQVQTGYVLFADEHRREAALLIEGVTCAACLWLIEQRLLRLHGLTAATVNYATRRLRISWDASRVKLSEILAAIAALGYQAHLYDSGRSEAVLARERRALLWRACLSQRSA